MATSDSTRPYIVALTGGIASGKSTVANLFAELGVPVIDADQLARDVVEPGHPALARVVAAFGPEILDAKGSYDRKRMRELVFADPAKRKLLESILHPAIRDEFARRSAAAVGPYQIHMIPLLVEGGRQSTADRVLVVDCPEDVQLARLEARDGSSPEQARQILAAQASRAQRLAVADDVVVNDGRIAELTARVRELNAKYLELAALANRG
jgi:dephospho-CoA kinase